MPGWQLCRTFGQRPNLALLDIVGQAAKAPVYQVLGGPTRHKVRALAVVTAADDDAVLAACKRARAAGFRAFVVPAVPLPEKPGLGFDLTEAALAKYPFAGTRPMARVFAPDGSVVEW